MHLAHDSAPEWMVVDDAITRLAASKGALDVELGRWLLVARREGVERKLGFGSFAEYVERRLGFDARTTFERLRVARALEVLPAIEGLLRAGRRSWSAVRELTRVATPDNEAAWVEASERMTVRQVEAMVAGRELGANPWDPRDPVLTPYRLVLELPADELADWQEAAEKVRREIGPAATHREVLRALVQKELGARPESAPGYQTAVTLCAGCERAWQQAGGELVEVAPAVGDCARCDGAVVGVVEVEGAAAGAASAHVGGARRRLQGGNALAGGERSVVVDDIQSAHVGGASERLQSGNAIADGEPGVVVDDIQSAHVGTLADDEPGLAALLGRLVRRRGSRVLTRVMAAVIGAPPRTMTPKLRAAVRARDRGRCVVPGCRHFRFVDLHHQRPRAAGGPNTLENVLTLCTQHHQLVHEGVLAIEGVPGRGLVVRHSGGTLYGATRSIGSDGPAQLA